MKTTRFRRFRVVATLLVAVAALVAGSPATAWAYIDPGTGSLAFQALLGVLLVAGMMFRRAWATIQGWLRPGRTPPSPGVETRGPS